MILERLGIAAPVVQAGMGGGLSGHELAASVSEAGGLGTIAVNGAPLIARELAAAKAATGKPLAVNILLPFARPAWFSAASGADAIVTFWGRPRRRAAGVWIHQCGSPAEARAAHAAGADGLILQGVEAGGHVRGTTAALELLEQVRAALPRDYPLLLAGGIAERGDVSVALEAGASAAVAGTRFLLSDESCAHPEYKRRLLDAEETVLTDLFGAGWPAPHRVVPNQATERWLGADGRAPALNRALNHLLSLGARRMPAGLAERMAGAQRPASRLLSPLTLTSERPATMLEAGPLYAGETVKRIGELRPAGELVRELSP